jgi:tol-pal system protein YbgF
MLLLPLVLGGCSQQLKRMEGRMDEVANAQRSIEADLAQMREEVEAIGARERQREQDYAERRAELESQLLALDRAVRRMDARAEEQDALLRRISAALDILLRSGGTASVFPSGVDSSGAGPPSDVSASPSANDLDAAAVGGGVAGGLAAGAILEQEPADGSPATDVFDAAFADFTRGNYALAREGFEELLRGYPRSELADDAAYWIAEAYYSEGEHAQALERFEAILQTYPRADTLAATLLKIGYCQIELDRSEEAAATFERLRRDYPESDEALIAEHKLSAMASERP